MKIESRDHAGAGENRSRQQGSGLFFIVKISITAIRFLFVDGEERMNRIG
jgi:hypothetical protein